MKSHPVRQEIISLLEQNNCWFETFEHEAVRTSEEAALTRPGFTLRQGTKAIIVRAKIAGGSKKFVMLVMPGDKRFSNDKVKAALAAKDIRFATEQEVAEITGGVLPGGVPPFGTLFGLEVLVDESLYQNESIVFNAGERTFSIAMKSGDFKKLVRQTITKIV